MEQQYGNYDFGGYGGGGVHKVIGLLGRMVMVTVAAILIGGYLAAPAAAQARADGVQEANHYITWCFAQNGDPEVVEADGEIVVVNCKFRGLFQQCVWSQLNNWFDDCTFHDVPRPDPGNHLHTVEPGDLHTFEPAPASVTAT